MPATVQQRRHQEAKLKDKTLKPAVIEPALHPQSETQNALSALAAVLFVTLLLRCEAHCGLKEFDSASN
jgi:hypothetical protein